MQQLKQDMRYRVKVQNLSKSPGRPGGMAGTSDEPLVFDSDMEQQHHHHHHGGEHQKHGVGNDLVKRDENSNVSLADASSSSFDNASLSTTTESSTTTTVDPRNDYIIQNWQFEIRKLTFDDAGTYQCLLPLVKPIAKNITLQVIRKWILIRWGFYCDSIKIIYSISELKADLTIEPKEGGNYKLDDKIVLKCRATMRTLHKTPSLHLIHQRQSKSSILWYKENEILKSSVRRTTATADDEPSSSSHDQETAATNNDDSQQQHKIEIETKLDNNEQTLNSILTISHAREADSGKYRCIYDNIQENVQIRVTNDRKLIFVFVSKYCFWFQILKNIFFSVYF